ncbi:MAG: TIGR02099 family protein [Brachymonas sp.]|nr:TIGR02099 family protein [Brachymonas sp.]
MSFLASLLWKLSATVAVVFALVWLAIYGLIVPRIGEFRPALENRLSSALGVPLRIGSISAHVQGLMPTFEMSQVRLLNAQGADALVLSSVTAAVSPRSLLELGFEQLLIDRPELVVARDANGRITVAGLDLSTQSSADNSSVGADWLFSQSELVIRSGRVRWEDAQRGAPPLALEQVDIVLRNKGRQHLMRLEATPPQAWGQRFQIAGDLRSPLLAQHPGDWRTWEGQLHADLPKVDVQELKRYASLGIDLDQGQGAMRGWVLLDRGLVTDITADLALEQVNMRLRSDLAPLQMSKLTGRFALANTPQRLSVSTQGLGFELQDGLRWPGGNVSLELLERNEPQAMKGTFTANQLDVAALSQISDRLPLDATVRRWLLALQPKGLISRLQATWQGPVEQLRSYEVKGSTHGIFLRSSAQALGVAGIAAHTKTDQPWHPGVSNGQLEFQFNEKKGQAQLRVDQGSIGLPGVFEESVVAFDQLSTDITWQIDGSKWQVQLADLKFSNADAQGAGRASWQTSDPEKSASKSRFPGILDLQGTLDRAEGTRVHRYLPMFIAQPARQYVRDAVLQGKASQGSFKIKGDLYDMPFTDPARGEFRIAAQVTGAMLDYVPKRVLPTGSLPWPALTQIQGELVFDRQSMAVRNATARIANAPSVQLTKVEALIPDLTQKQQVQIQAEAKSSAVDLLNLIKTTPLSEISNQALAQTTVNGLADAKLKLLLPIEDLSRSKVQGTITLLGNDFQYSPQTPKLEQARGQIVFSERGFAVRDATARALGGELRLEAASRPTTGASDVSMALRAQGVATAEGLRSAKEIGLVANLAEQASGTAAYALSLNIRRGIPEVAISSNLQGMALNLPQPMSKSAEALMPLRYDNFLVRESLAEGRKLQDQIALEIGNIATVNYWRDVSNPAARVLKGRIGVGLAPGEAIAASEDAGVAANINFAQVNLDTWERLLSGLNRTANATASTTAGLSAQTQDYLPSIMSVRARELTIQGRTLNNVVVGGSREDVTWRANLDAREMNGYVEYRQASANTPGRVYARLARLSLETAQVSDLENTLDQQPTSIPALDVVVEDLELRGKRLGKLELEAQNRDSGGVREWRLSRLNLSMPEAQFNATGNWALVGATQSSTQSPPRNTRNERRRTALNFKLDIADSGELLKRFGQDKVIARGKGRMEGTMGWLGAPWTFDYPSLNGGFNVQIETGQFLKADPGIAKLLGVLSLQSLPRRLALDFKDVFSEGFQFDFIRGDVKIDQGLAYTNNLQMKGVNAAVLMEGNANIARETQDLKVVVVPEINAGTASLVATAINPAIGIGTFLAQLVLRRPVIEAATQEFHVVGSWSDPQIQRVKRNSVPAPASTPAAASAADTEKKQ